MCSQKIYKLLEIRHWLGYCEWRHRLRGHFKVTVTKGVGETAVEDVTKREVTGGAGVMRTSVYQK